MDSCPHARAAVVHLDDQAEPAVVIKEIILSVYFGYAKADIEALSALRTKSVNEMSRQTPASSQQINGRDRFSFENTVQPRGRSIVKPDYAVMSYIP